MIDSVSRFDAVYAPLPQKFEAGTETAAALWLCRRPMNIWKASAGGEINKQEDLLTEMAMGGDEAYPRCSSDRKHRPEKKHHGIISFYH